MHRFDYGDKGIKSDAIIAFLIGYTVAFVVQVYLFSVAPGGIFTTLIVSAVGGLWYNWRRIL